MKTALSILTILLLEFAGQSGLAADNRLTINGVVDPDLKKVIFSNSANIDPVIFENDHHAINKCYKILGGYLTFITSGEGLFEGYELNKYIPPELSGKQLRKIDESVKNKAGVSLGSHRKDLERIIKQKLTDDETTFSFESTKKIRGVPYDVITTVIVQFEKDELTKFIVITSTTS
jgi:hypothetical protein